MRTFPRKGKPSAWHATSDSKFSALHGDALDFRYEFSDLVVTLIADPWSEVRTQNVKILDFQYFFNYSDE